MYQRSTYGDHSRENATLLLKRKLTDSHAAADAAGTARAEEDMGVPSCIT